MRDFFARPEGSILPLFALTALALVLLSGVAIDYSRENLASVRLQEAADSAVLQALGDHQKDAVGAARASAAQAEATARFQAIAAQFGYSKVAANAVAGAANPLTLTLNYSSSVATTIGRAVNIRSMNVSGVSAGTAGATASKYVDIYFLVDVSGSMGIGATTADQILMGNDANIPNLDQGEFPGDNSVGCMFACHTTGTDAQAHADGATLRIDVVQKALQSVLAASQNAAQGTVQFSLITFGDGATVQAPLSSNFSSISNAVNNLQLAGDGSGTSVGYALNYVSKIIPTPGDGSSATKPLVYVILATDGVENAINFSAALWTDGSPPNPNAFPPYSTTTETSPFPHEVPFPTDSSMMLSGIDPAWCQPLKTEGAQVMTLEMPYVVPPVLYGGKDPRFVYIQNVLLPIIPGELTACASQPSYHVSATAPSDIVAALNTLYSQAVGAGGGEPYLTR